MAVPWNVWKDSVRIRWWMLHWPPLSQSTIHYWKIDNPQWLWGLRSAGGMVLDVECTIPLARYLWKDFCTKARITLATICFPRKAPFTTIRVSEFQFDQTTCKVLCWVHFMSVSDNPDVNRRCLNFCKPCRMETMGPKKYSEAPWTHRHLFQSESLMVTEWWMALYVFGWTMHQTNPIRNKIALACSTSHQAWTKLVVSIDFFRNLTRRSTSPVQAHSQRSKSEHDWFGSWWWASSLIPRLSGPLAETDWHWNRRNRSHPTQRSFIYFGSHQSCNWSKNASNCTTDGRTVGTPIPQTRLSCYSPWHHSLEQSSSLDDILALWSQCLNLEEITGDWMQENLKLTSKEDIAQFVSSVVKLKIWTETEDAKKILSLLQLSNILPSTATKNSGMPLAPRAEIKLYNDCSKFFIENWGGAVKCPWFDRWYHPRSNDWRW